MTSGPLDLPKQRYDVIAADPPWAYLWGTGKAGGNFAPEKHYRTLSVDELCDLPVRDLRAPNCALALWTTGPTLPDALRVMDAWGFKYKTALFVWVKLNPKSLTVVTGPGSYTRSACEYVLLGMRGHLKRATTEPVSQVIQTPRGRHSAKPDLMQEGLERLWPDASRIELFARRRRPGWDSWGDELEA